MNLYIRLMMVFLVSWLLASCVKNEPFFKPYQVPNVFVPETKDSSAAISVIMMQGVRNYLSTSKDVLITQKLFDSLWNNKDSSFTIAMVPNFIYSNNILNRRIDISLARKTSNADTMISFVDKIIALSANNGQAGSNGVQGMQMQQIPTMAKRLFDEKGVEYLEVWSNAMLGAMALQNAYQYFTTSLQNASSNWDLAYQYFGFPKDFDLGFNYTATPLKSDRPLSIAALFTSGKSSNIGATIYEEFRRAKASAVAGNINVAQSSSDTIKLYSEKLLALTAVTSIDSLKQISDPVAKLHYLSQTYGLVWALKFRTTVALSDTNYWLMRNNLTTNFYTLIQEPGYGKIEQVRSVLTAAYHL